MKQQFLYLAESTIIFLKQTTKSPPKAKLNALATPTLNNHIPVVVILPRIFVKQHIWYKTLQQVTTFSASHISIYCRAHCNEVTGHQL